ncbi:MAG TPA: hypothetical protein VF240_09995 [Pyrinomonadaceae bacterium]
MRRRKTPVARRLPPYPEFARFLVERGINSISLNPDTVIQTTHLIHEAEAACAPPANGERTAAAAPLRHAAAHDAADVQRPVKN